MKYIRIIVYTYYNVVNKLIFNMMKVKFKDFDIKGIIFVKNRGKITIGTNFKATSHKYINPIGGDTLLRLITEANGILQIGNNVGITNSTIFCTKRIIIEDYVYIGGGCKIWDTDHHSIDPLVRTSGHDNLVIKKEVIIKSYAFIGADSIILKGVCVGKNSVVGAGSVVTKSIPDNEVWAGNPAKFIKNI